MQSAPVPGRPKAVTERIRAAWGRYANPNEDLGARLDAWHDNRCRNDLTEHEQNSLDAYEPELVRAIEKLPDCRVVTTALVYTVTPKGKIGTTLRWSNQ